MIVEVEQGKLEGLTRKSILTGNDYCAFLGIPYAKPPVGKLRFQIPQPIEKWDGVLNAKKEGSPCVQRFFSGDYIGSEDCLYLNVYTPAPPVEDATPKAVMVFIHGGAYLAGSGSSDLYSPDYLIGHDVVLVTMNYRLHALGFLNLGTKNSADNCGLRDQWLALKWVNENIQHFGGDPKNITIFGNSAGASSVYFHLISPKSRGLFNKAIMQSDPVYSFLDDRYNNTYRQMAFDLAKRLGFDGNDPEKLVEFLQNQPAMEIAKNIRSIFDSEMTIQEKSDMSNMFRPTTDDTNDDGFLPDTLENLRKAATPVPLIIGFNNKEGRMAFQMFGQDLLEILQNGFSKTIQRPYQITDSEFQNICDKIRQRYLGDEAVYDETAEKVADVFTNYWFRKFYESFDFITNSEKPVYIYEFKFFGKFNLFGRMYLKDRPEPTSGAAHSDELPYLFYPSQMMPHLQEISDPERTVVKNVCTLWTNFAKTNNPTENFSDSEWKQFSSEKPCFLQIDKELRLIEEKLRGREFAFWKELLL